MSITLQLNTQNELFGSHPKCTEHRKLAKMRVVKNLMKPSYERSFFVCSDKAKPCSFWVWGDVEISSRPVCRHGLLCIIRKVKKEGLNKDRKFFCCPKTRASTLIGCPKSLIITPISYNHSKANQSKRERNIS